MRCLTLVLCILLVEGLSKATAQTVKFSSFFPLLSAATYEETSKKTCDATLTAYHRSLRGSNATDHAATCSYQQRCILANLRPDISARMASASVLLGLTPGLLAGVGPSASEISLLSMDRPLISFLISLGCPAVFPSRVLQYDDARHVLSTPGLNFGLQQFTSQRTAWMRYLLVTKYLLLCGAIVNIFYTSWELGTKSVVSFRCINYTLPLVWTTLSMAVHTVAASAFHVRYIYHQIERYWAVAVQDRATRHWNDASDDVAHLAVTSLHKSGTDYHHLRLEQRIEPTKVTVTVNYLATIMGFAHVTFGILIFSSLQFIEVIDVALVILRYLTSTLVSRLILINELGEVRRQNEFQSGVSDTSPNKPIDQPLPFALPTVQVDDDFDIDLTAISGQSAKSHSHRIQETS